MFNQSPIAYMYKKYCNPNPKEPSGILEPTGTPKKTIQTDPYYYL